MTTRLSQFNNTGIPLGTGLTFTGRFERTLTGLEISTFVNCSGLSLVTIEQSTDASSVQITSTFNYNPVNDVSTFSVPVALPFFRIKLFNGDIVAQAYLSLNTYVINTPPQQVVVAGGSLDVIVGGVVDVSGSVVASNLITETLATRRVDFLVVGDYYRVASVGITTGAQWNEIGAIVDGESVPVIGRLFKCLQAGPAVQNGGTCYDVEYTDAVSATITNFPAFPATQAVSIAQDLSCNILNFPATQPVSGTVSLTNPTVVRVADFYGLPITTTAGNTNININAISTITPLHTIVDSGSVTVSSLPAITGSVSVSSLPALATGTNSIGKISEITNTVTTKISNSIYTNARDLALSNTGVVVKSSAGTLRGITCSNTDNTAYTYVKIYDKATAPTSADTPVVTIPVYKNTSETYDFFSLEMFNGISMRATLGLADSDNTPAVGMVVFVSYDGS